MRRVLIVEDHQKLLRSLRRGLELHGFEVLATETGEAGYDLALTQNVDALILDLMLPDRNGFEILRDLRQAGFHKPVLILTAKDSPEDRRRGQSCGADGFMAKPFAFSDLLTRLNELLQRTDAAETAVEESP